MAKTVAEMIGEAKARVEAVSPKDAADEVAAGKAVFLDVREPVEWEHHIEGAVQVPRGLLEFVADPASPKHKPELDPAGRVIVYCRSGIAGRPGLRDAQGHGLRERRQPRGRLRRLAGGRPAGQRAPRRALSERPPTRTANPTDNERGSDDG